MLAVMKKEESTLHPVPCTYKVGMGTEMRGQTHNSLVIQGTISLVTSHVTNASELRWMMLVCVRY